MENTHVTYANTLRRLIMTGIETIAFNADMKNGTTSDVTVLKNDTPMTNEMLAHRIGLLPITVAKPINYNRADYTFTLDVTGEPDKMRDVTCSDFVITKGFVPEGKEPIIIPTDEFFPKNKTTKSTCLIATLPAGTTRLHLIAQASKGTGRENARYQPTSQCSYTYTLDKDRARQEEYLDKWLREVKKYEYTEEDKETPKYKAYVREFQTMEINRIYKRLPNGEPYSFDFIIETIGTLDVPYIVQHACDVGEGMMSRLLNIDQAGFNLKEHGITIMPSISNTFGVDFILEHQDHTFGNMIQTYLSENHMADQITDTTTQKITYVGYEIPHQLRDEMVLRIGLDTDTKNLEADARRAFAQACKGCYDIFVKMRNAFIGTELEGNRDEGMKPVAESKGGPKPASKTTPKGKRQFPVALQASKK
jgi:DNA-directed RNA polymerase subunit L